MLGLYCAVLLVPLTPFAASAVNVAIPLTAPRGAPLVAPDLISLSIEQDRWPEWAGTTEPNQFFYNALDNLVQITKSSPFIRIGADSEDRTDFSFDVEYEEAHFNRPSPIIPYPEASNLTVGQGFYNIISHLPSGTRVHWGVNLKHDNLTAAYLQTRALIEAFQSPAVREKGITLNFIEVGNEADLYNHKSANIPSTWTISEYIPRWVKFATNISETAGISETSLTKFIGGAFAGFRRSFSPEALFAHGILDTLPGKLITTFSQHGYRGVFCSGTGALLQDLMAKSYIRGNLSTFEPHINATLARGWKYVLGETNSVACHGSPGVSNTAGAALWALDFSLHSSQIGISRLHFHEGIGYKYNFIQPVTLNYSIADGSPIAPLPPHIQPPYYAAVIAAEAIGSTGHTQVAELAIDSIDVSGYAIFEHGNLRRAVFINSAAFLPGDGTRKSAHIDIQFPGSGQMQKMQVKRLAITYANATSRITWGGQTYETADARVSGPLQVKTFDVSKGLDIQQTEAVLLSFL